MIGVMTDGVCGLCSSLVGLSWYVEVASGVTVALSVLRRGEKEVVSPVLCCVVELAEVILANCEVE